jgi:hypothetical protein
MGKNGSRTRSSNCFNNLARNSATVQEGHILTKRVMRRVKASNCQPSVSHRCSYLKEEVILGPTVAESAILMTSNPTIHEVCFVCGERVERTGV